VTRRELALAYAWEFLGTFYSWGGDDPAQGFDCSGLMVEVLKGAGILARGSDFTAEGLRTMFQEVSTPTPGCLVFRLSPATGKAVHVEMVYKVIEDEPLTIGASGGGSKTLTREDAIKANAFVKCRPWSSHSTITRYADPFLPD
jgi:hypothetical protein